MIGSIEATIVKHPQAAALVILAVGVCVAFLA